MSPGDRLLIAAIVAAWVLTAIIGPILVIRAAVRIKDKKWRERYKSMKECKW